MKSFFMALQFLTRLPLAVNVGNDPQHMGRSLLWYPLIGIAIGLLLGALAWAVQHQPAMPAAALLLIAWVLITGGLHLDGLADSADAWAGGVGDKEKSLAIMKDPHVGSFAVIMLLLVLILKFAALNTLLQQPDSWRILLAPLLGRCAVLFLFLTTPYVRAHGLGSAMAMHLPRRWAMIIGLLFFVPVLIWLPPVALGTLLVLIGLRYLMLKRLHGMTGDTIGASIEIVEATALLVLVF
jgi:adenosylcobinamide-GDP ribazoletransferase